MIQIDFKNDIVYRYAFTVPWDKKLLDIYQWLHDRYGIGTITSAYRQGDVGSVHNTIPLRGIDLRSTGKFEGIETEIEDAINTTWLYDPKRPHKRVCTWHDAGSGLHFHIQVHPNTVMI